MLIKKLLLVLTFTPFIAFGQYSNYYNINANINKNVKVSGNINKTVTTIDFGALANANALQEQNRLANIKYINENERIKVLAIASDPSKAFDYGTDNNWKLTRKERKGFGWGKGLRFMYHKVPHSSLFLNTGTTGYTYENLSIDGITTQIIINTIFSFDKIKETNPNFNFNNEDLLEYKDYIEGQLNGESFLHKKDIGRANIAGLDGFCGSIIYEDKYEKIINEYYVSIASFNDKNYWISADVTFKGDKDEIVFEQLEGRRYYFKQLISKIISTIKVY